MKRGTGEVLVDGIHGHDSQNIYWNARVRGYLSIFYTLCNEFNHQLHATIKNLLPINSNQKIESSTRIRTLTISSLVLTGRKKDEPKAKHLCASWFKAFCLEEALVTMCKIDILSMWLLNPFLTRSTSISITGWHDVEKIFIFLTRQTTEAQVNKPKFTYNSSIQNQHYTSWFQNCYSPDYNKSCTSGGKNNAK